MTRRITALLLAAGLCLSATALFADHHGDGDHPPMLVLMPPPDVEKPDGVEMTGDPEEDFRTVFRAFFRMMDQDGNGELARDELRDWVHPPRMPEMGDHDGGMGMPGMPGGMPGMGRPDGDMEEHMDGEMAEKVRELKEELRRLREEQHKRRVEQMREHRSRLQEQIRHAREEQQRIADRLRQMEEEARKMEEEMERGPEEMEDDRGPRAPFGN